MKILHWEFFDYGCNTLVKEIRTNDLLGSINNFTLDKILQEYNKMYEYSSKELLEENFYNFINTNIEYY